MFRGSWVAAIAIGLALCFAASGLAQESQTSRSSNADQHAQKSGPEPGAGHFQTQNKRTQDSSEGREEERRQREIEDLIAQQGMNAATQAIKDATLEMRDYAYYSTIAVVVGTLLLFLTLILTWRANRAANRAVDVTRSVGVDQSRAYLGIGTGENDNVLVFFGGGEAEARIMVKNYGSTPGHNIKFKLTVIDAKGIPQSRSGKLGYLAPSGNHTFISARFSPANERPNKIDLVLQYKTMGKPAQTKICLQNFVKNGHRLSELQTRQDGNEMT